MSYMLTCAKGSVVFEDNGTVQSENTSISGSLTSHPMENGSKITDHFVRNPDKGSIAGKVVQGGVSEMAKMERMVGEICTYSGVQIIRNLVPTSINFKYDSSIKNGFTFTLNWEQARIVSAQFVQQSSGSSSASSQDSDKPKNSSVSNGGTPKQSGTQTTQPTTVTASNYNSYVDSFNNKTTPSNAPAGSGRSTYTGVT